MQNKVGFVVVPIGPVRISRNGCMNAIWECNSLYKTSFYCLLIYAHMNLSLSNLIPSPIFEILLSAKSVWYLNWQQVLNTKNVLVAWPRDIYTEPTLMVSWVALQSMTICLGGGGENFLVIWFLLHSKIKIWSSPNSHPQWILLACRALSTTVAVDYIIFFSFCLVWLSLSEWVENNWLVVLEHDWGHLGSWKKFCLGSEIFIADQEVGSDWVTMLFPKLVVI